MLSCSLSYRSGWTTLFFILFPQQYKSYPLYSHKQRTHTLIYLLFRPQLFQSLPRISHITDMLHSSISLGLSNVGISSLVIWLANVLSEIVRPVYGNLVLIWWVLRVSICGVIGKSIWPLSDEVSWYGFGVKQSHAILHYEYSRILYHNNHIP